MALSSRSRSAAESMMALWAGIITGSVPQGTQQYKGMTTGAHLSCSARAKKHNCCAKTSRMDTHLSRHEHQPAWSISICGVSVCPESPPFMPQACPQPDTISGSGPASFYPGRLNALISCINYWPGCTDYIPSAECFMPSSLNLQRKSKCGGAKAW